MVARWSKRPVWIHTSCASLEKLCTFTRSAGCSVIENAASATGEASCGHAPVSRTSPLYNQAESRWSEAEARLPSVVCCSALMQSCLVWASSLERWHDLSADHLPPWRGVNGGMDGWRGVRILHSKNTPSVRVVQHYEIKPLFHFTSLQSEV